MPTNYLRRSSKGTPPHAHIRPKAIETPKKIRLQIGAHDVLIDLEPTQSAALIAAALPLYSIAETWGESIHFEIPIRGGRDRTARINAEVGALYYWSEDERLLLVFGPTPISGRGEIRLPRPCNLIGRTSDDLTALSKVHPGQKISLTHA